MGFECYIESSLVGSYIIFINIFFYSVVIQQVIIFYEIFDVVIDVLIVFWGDGIVCKVILNGDESIYFFNIVDVNLILIYILV